MSGDARTSTVLRGGIASEDMRNGHAGLFRGCQNPPDNTPAGADTGMTATENGGGKKKRVFVFSVHPCCNKGGNVMYCLCTRRYDREEKK